MDRREMLKGTVGGLMLAAAGNPAFAGEHAGHSADHQHMQGMNKNQELIDTAADCVKKGYACVSHGVQLWTGGENKGMAICAMRVSEMIAACQAIEQLALYDSAHLAKMAKVVMDVCRDCEKECRKFEAEHVQCKQAADACDACFKACEKIVS